MDTLLFRFPECRFRTPSASHGDSTWHESNGSVGCVVRHDRYAIGSKQFNCYTCVLHTGQAPRIGKESAAQNVNRMTKAGENQRVIGNAIGTPCEALRTGTTLKILVRSYERIENDKSPRCTAIATPSARAATVMIVTNRSSPLPGFCQASAA